MEKNQITLGDVLSFMGNELARTEGFDRDGTVVRPDPLDALCKGMGSRALELQYDGEVMLVPLEYRPGHDFLGPVSRDAFCKEAFINNPQQLNSGLIVSERVAKESNMPHKPYDVNRELYVFLVE